MKKERKKKERKIEKMKKERNKKERKRAENRKQKKKTTTSPDNLTCIPDEDNIFCSSILIFCRAEFEKT
jgi:hypothetical protein